MMVASDQIQIMRSARWTTFSKAAGQLLTFATTLVLVRFLQKEDFGLFAMALFYIWIIDNVTDFGFLSAIIQCKDINPCKVSSCFWLIAVSCLLIILISQVAAPVAAWLFSEARIGPIVRVLSFAFLLFPFTVVCTGLLSRQLRLDVVATSELGVKSLRRVLSGQDSRGIKGKCQSVSRKHERSEVAHAPGSSRAALATALVPSAPQCPGGGRCG